MYIHEQPAWPNFTWDRQALAGLLAEIHREQGRLLGRMEALGQDQGQDATLQSLTQDVVRSSEIEGEHLEAAQVRSSLARRMGLDAKGLKPLPRDREGLVEVLLDATQNHDHALTRARLFQWHAALFRGSKHVKAGTWRGSDSGAMQVVSGAIGREKIHFEAPGHSRVPTAMTRLLAWFNGPTLDGLVAHSALAHFYFVTIHPFEDGNGRIARALSDLLLARSERSAQRFYSLSRQIQTERSGYYKVLERTQRSGLDVTAWMDWYLHCLGRAIADSGRLLDGVLAKAAFWKANEGSAFNARQRLILNRLLDGFEGKLTSSKWAKIARCSPDTALRDIKDLIERQLLSQESGGGRSTGYRWKAP